MSAMSSASMSFADVQLYQLSVCACVRERERERYGVSARFCEGMDQSGSVGKA